MGKNFQRNFLIIFLSILLVIFAILYGVICIIFTFDHNKDVRNQLNEIYEVYIDSDKSLLLENSFIAQITSDVKTENGNYLFIAKYDEKIFDDENIQKVINEAVSNNFLFGNLSNIYYLNVKDASSPYIVGLNATTSLKALESNNLTTLIILLVSYTLISLLAIGLSFKFIKPIKQAFYKQRQLISNASHELKTPISIISANNEVLKNIDNNQWVKNIDSQAKRMQSLVSDMLTLAKYEENTNFIIKEDFNLSNNVVGISLSFDALAFENGCQITLNVPDNIEYHGDCEGIKKIIYILLDNAVKYASKNSEIVLTLKNDSRPTISVFNLGSDVPTEEAYKIFERFYRADNSRSRATGGSGLGLAIAKSIADANKWKLTAKSKQGEYMLITLTL